MTMATTKLDSYAAKLLEQADITSAPVDVARAAEVAGALVAYQPLKSELSGVLVKEKDRVIIGVNSAHSKTRQRFTIAHELGHLVLKHKGEVFVDHTVLRRDGKSSQAVDKQEIEANGFAAALLMPEAFVLDRLEYHQSERPSVTSSDLIEVLAKDFGVSAEAMGYRLANLGFFMPA